MLQETKLELHTTGYGSYLDSGGQFSYSEYLFAQKKLSDIRDMPNISVDGTLPRYMEDMASLCGLEATPIEKILYAELSRKRKSNPLPLSDEEKKEQEKKKEKSPCRMGDIELAREVFLFTDSSMEKYDAMTERFPNVFSPSQ